MELISITLTSNALIYPILSASNLEITDLFVRLDRILEIYLSTVTETLCQELFKTPLKFQTPPTLSGWTLYDKSVALHINLTVPSGLTLAADKGSLQDHSDQAHIRCSGCFDSCCKAAVFQVLPPSAETSTRTIPRPPSN